MLSTSRSSDVNGSFIRVKVAQRQRKAMDLTSFFKLADAERQKSCVLMYLFRPQGEEYKELLSDRVECNCCDECREAQGRGKMRSECRRCVR